MHPISYPDIAGARGDFATDGGCQMMDVGRDSPAFPPFSNGGQGGFEFFPDSLRAKHCFIRTPEPASAQEAASEFAGVFQEIAHGANFAILEFEQGHPLVFVRLLLSGYPPIDPVGGRPVSLDDHFQHPKRELRILKEKHLKEAQDFPPPEKGLGLREEELRFFFQVILHSPGIPGVDELEEFGDCPADRSQRHLPSKRVRSQFWRHAAFGRYIIQ